MRKSFLNFAMGVITVLGLATSACSVDNCKNVECGTQGTCDEVDGSCMCNAGYEADANAKCETEGRAKFVGVWRGTDNGSSSKPSYDLTIATSSVGVETIRVTNFANSDCPAGSPTVATAKVVKGTDGKHMSLNSVASDCSDIKSVDATTMLSLSADGKSLTVKYKFTVNDGTTAGYTYDYTDVLTKQ